jgi:membrane-bound ClpP family serine protease
MGELLLILALLIGAMLLILAEICTPTFGILAIAAMACLGALVWRCFLIAPWLGILALVAVIVGVPVYLRLMIGLFPKTPFGRKLMLGSGTTDTGGGVPESAEHEGLIGAEGVASSALRPSGTVTIDGRRRVATAESGFISENTPIRVVRSSGLNLVVRAIDSAVENQD